MEPPPVTGRRRAEPMRFGRGSAGHSSKGQMTRIKQIIVRRPGRYRQSHEKLIKKGANPIPRVPRQVPDRVSIFRGRLFPQSRAAPSLRRQRHRAFIFCWPSKSPIVPRRLAACCLIVAFARKGTSSGYNGGAPMRGDGVSIRRTFR
jgi:hypothetical protein